MRPELEQQAQGETREEKNVARVRIKQHARGRDTRGAEKHEARRNSSREDTQENAS